ncbi:hypothetical protein RR46_03753 [Papilio xuthus]|uniref:Uncharacterized protein n=1 Tax=Papilio xuthus TaxID=66420 RepID=A0A194Q227_PAPXU|nr:hypothetical protein RR46_03753 [Papilio xuthus]
MNKRHRDRLGERARRVWRECARAHAPSPMKTRARNGGLLALVAPVLFTFPFVTRTAFSQSPSSAGRPARVRRADRHGRAAVASAVCYCCRLTL